MTPADVQATFCATLVDEWIYGGVRDAVVAPGSRSTPMALAIADRSELALHVVHDERVAAFVALGIGVASGVPALLLCTSGTAAANFHPAVAEAGLSAIPMLVLTADRPPELRGVGAPQTIDQLELYGTCTTFFHDAAVPDAAGAGGWRALARDALVAGGRGPAHLNLPFREPLIGVAGVLPPRDAVATDRTPSNTAEVASGGMTPVRSARGLILAGGLGGVDIEQIAALAAATGWPVLADPTSPARRLDGAIVTFDALLRNAEFAASHHPDVVVRIGRPAASKVLTQFVVASGAPVIQIGGPGTIDPDHNVTTAYPAQAIDALSASAVVDTEPGWAEAWRRADEAAGAAITELLGTSDVLTEPGVARTIADRRPAATAVVVASSMPVRDYEWFGGRNAVGYANRGANGIDGVMSTALGVAVASGPTVVLLGDVAFVHDAGALTGLAGRGADLRVVVVDNGGGGIFSFLPQATSLDGGRFERLFGTPHRTDLLALARAHRLDAAPAATVDELVERLARPGPHVTVVATNRDDNVAWHAALNQAAVEAVG